MLNTDSHAAGERSEVSIYPWSGPVPASLLDNLCAREITPGRIIAISGPVASGAGDFASVLAESLPGPLLIAEEDLASIREIPATVERGKLVIWHVGARTDSWFWHCRLRVEALVENENWDPILAEKIFAIPSVILYVYQEYNPSQGFVFHLNPGQEHEQGESYCAGE